MHVPQHWRLKAQRYALVGSQCPSCGSTIFPPRPTCPVCQKLRASQGLAYILEIPVGEPEMAVAFQNVKVAPLEK